MFAQISWYPLKQITLRTTMTRTSEPEGRERLIYRFPLRGRGKRVSLLLSFSKNIFEFRKKVWIIPYNNFTICIKSQNPCYLKPEVRYIYNVPLQYQIRFQGDGVRLPSICLKIKITSVALRKNSFLLSLLESFLAEMVGFSHLVHCRGG